MLKVKCKNCEHVREAKINKWLFDAIQPIIDKI